MKSRSYPGPEVTGFALRDSRIIDFDSPDAPARISDQDSPTELWPWLFMLHSLVGDAVECEAQSLLSIRSSVRLFQPITKMVTTGAKSFIASLA